MVLGMRGRSHCYGLLQLFVQLTLELNLVLNVEFLFEKYKIQSTNVSQLFTDEQDNLQTPWEFWNILNCLSTYENGWFPQFYDTLIILYWTFP